VPCIRTTTPDGFNSRRVGRTSPDGLSNPLSNAVWPRPYQSGIRLSEHLDGDGETIFRHACALGAEGIVAKRRDRPYRSGRCADWVKVKNPDSPRKRAASFSDQYHARCPA